MREVNERLVPSNVRRNPQWRGFVPSSGSLKTEVAKDPAKYIVPDESLKRLLTALKMSGRSVLTNSLFDYTNVVMNFLISDKTGDAKTLDWLDYFDTVFVGSMKPLFYSR